MGDEDERARLMRFILEMRQAGITDPRALAALETIPRAHYAPPHLQALALDDVGLPLPHGQVMTKPSLIGRMLAALDPQPGEAVLEIGTGSGFQAACIARTARRVVTVDRWRTLVTDARASFGSARLLHVTAHLADGAEGFAEHAPYDRIIVNAAIPDFPMILREQLNAGGVMVAPLGSAEGQVLTRLRNGEREALGPVKFALLEDGIAPDPEA